MMCGGTPSINSRKNESPPTSKEEDNLQGAGPWSNSPVPLFSGISNKDLVSPYCILHFEMR